MSGDDRRGWSKLLELVHQISQDIGNFGKHSGYRSDDKPPGHAVVFEGIKVGDIVFSAESVEDGIDQSIVTLVTDTGHAMIVALYPAAYELRQSWLSADYARTPEEALKKQATEDVGFYGARFRLAQAALKAAETGGDVSRFMKGNTNPEAFDESESEKPKKGE